jgi:serine/threonine protein kinase
MTPPLTPVRTIDSGVSLSGLPTVPSIYAIKVPAMTSAKKVLGVESRILSYLTRFPFADTHIVPFYGLDTRTGSILLKAMDGTLESWIDEHLNTLDEAARAAKLAAVFPSLATSLLNSLIWLHEKGCIHADIKPSNMLISPCSPNSSAPHAVFSDFSSSVLTSSSSADCTIETAPVGAGTWDYLDPSLLLSSSNPASPDQTTDLWSLAITLLFLVLGASPYDAFKGNKFQQREMIKSGTPLQCLGYDDLGLRNERRLRMLSRDLGWDVKTWLGRVLVKDQTRRVGVTEWMAELKGWKAKM